MIYIWTWLAIACICVIAHANRFLTQDGAGVVMAVSLITLLAHRLTLWVNKLSVVSDDEPFPELHGTFLRLYHEAARYPSTHSWMQAAQAAKQWSDAVSKPKRHTLLRRRSA